MFSRRLEGLLLLTGLIVLLVAAAPATAPAGQKISLVDTYSACIKPPASGQRVSYLFNWTLGDTPSPGCGSSYSQVNLGGGDVSAVTAGTGLTGGGTNGALSLGADFGTGFNQVARGNHTHSAADLTSGTVPDGRLSGAYTGPLNFSNAANSFTGNGSGLTGLNASNLASGTVADARLSTNVARYSDISTPGTINNPSNPLEWTKLKSVPAGFADGTDDGGTAGQDGLVSYGTAGATVSVPGTFFILPGLGQTITVPANSVLHITTDGGAQTTSPSMTGFSIVDIALFIDGVNRPDAGARRLIINNTASLTQQFLNWSFADTVPLAAGSHTILIAAALVSGSNAVVSGNTTSVLQGQLSIVIVKR